MAPGIVNIGKDARGDMFHRYKMPLLQVKVEGKGNGIKTVIPNMSDIAKALSRPPTYPTKFFGCELGAQTTFDEKNDRYIVNGAHQNDRLRELLDSFIDKFVLCDSCKNPETDLIISKDEMISRDCKACGHRGLVDNRHKLCTFILKNPPETKSKKSKKDRKGSKVESPDPNGSSPTAHENGDAGVGDVDQDELTRRIEGEAVDAKTAERQSTLSADDWSADTSSDAVKARMKSLEAGVANGMSLGDDDDDAEGGGGPYEQFGEWVTENRETATHAEIIARAKELGIDKKHKAVQILGQTLFTEDAPKEVVKHAKLFQNMVTSEKHQKSLLGGIERLAGDIHPSLLPNGVPKIIMAFYQADVLEEDVIKQWGTHVSKKYVDKETSKKVRRACEPVLKWLDEAEDESTAEE